VENNKLLVVRRPGQTYYEIDYDQKGVPSHVKQHVCSTVTGYLDKKFYVFFAMKTVMFVDSAMFDALMNNGSMSYKDEIIIL
jgi:hypothetical protein